MNREELKEYLKDHDYPSGNTLNNPSSKHSHIFSDLKEHTNFLDDVFEEVKNTARCYCILYDKYEVPLCPACGNPVKIGASKDNKQKYWKSAFTTFCSKRCTSLGTTDKRKATIKEKTGYEHQMHDPSVKRKVAETNLEKYGAICYIATEEHQNKYKEEYKQETGYAHHFANPKVIEKRENSNTEKYGSPNAFQFSQDKINKTMNERYGVDYPLQNEEIKEKTTQTNLKKYGVKYPLQNEEIKEKTRLSNMVKYGQTSPTRSHFSNLATDTLFDKTKLKNLYKEIPNIHRMADYLGLGCARTVLLAMNRLDVETNDITRTSSYELEICKFLDDMNIEYNTNNRDIISPKELDIYIPGYNLAIEFNGVYWHSDKFKKPNYHQEKSLLCKDLGIKLVHIYEDMWTNELKKRILKEKIKTFLGMSKKERVYARKCFIENVDSSKTRIFYNNNHIQGANDCSLNYGMFKGDSLVACISFKYLGDGVYDLVRYATSCNVIGGFSKLWAHFLRNVEFQKVYTYASLDYSHGNLYERLGFELEYTTQPNYFYVDGSSMIRYSRQYFMKNKLKDRLEYYNDSLTEKQNVKNNGYYLIYDSGSLKFSFTK